ncbi:MAG: YggS family pyridoxal phosphate enzyme [Gemmatimonadetes bacterium RBG_16_66_8]|nr:MAG: YggS family pyridoxal phosphate enzyme [Gemmatimonadetes bacterium RBG_16_66_8]
MDLGAVRDRISRAAERSGRTPADITIVAVTKTHPIERVKEAVAAGLLDIGENRVLEAVAKQDQWPDAPEGVRWHMIGHLQRNKAKHAVGRFALIHSLDSVRLAEALEQAAAARNTVQPVLVEVSVAGEAQKSGAPIAEAEAIVRHAGGLPHLTVEGLMTMAPLTDDATVLRHTFRGLRELREHLTTAHCPLPTLSMGMSNDFEIAIEEGATMVRLGTVLFGERGNHT